MHIIFNNQLQMVIYDFFNVLFKKKKSWAMYEALRDIKGKLDKGRFYFFFNIKWNILVISAIS